MTLLWIWNVVMATIAGFAWGYIFAGSNRGD